MNRPQSPAVEFPLYGLDAAWVGPRWIEAFGERIGDPVSWVLLAHQAPQGRSVVFAYTLSRAVTLPADRIERDGRVWSAELAAFGLVNLTLPASSVARPDGMLSALVQHAEARCARHTEWPEISWRVDDVTVPARVWRFAGGWAAFTEALPDVYLAAADVANEPDGLGFARLSNGDAYDFDLNGRLGIPVFHASRTASGMHEFVYREGWHPDQLRLLPIRGS